MRNLAVLCDLHVSAGAELIIVDNLSNDGTRAELAALEVRLPTVKVLYSAANVGVAGGRNAGWAVATREWILNLDDDTRIDGAAVLALRAAAAQRPAAGIFTPKVRHALTGECQNGYGDDVEEPANFHGACHLVRARAWRAVGAIDAQCTFGAEELDYSIRARALGYATVYLPGIEVRHNSVLRPGAVGQWRRQRWIYNFSRIFFKHFPLRHAALLLARFMTAQLAAALRGGDVAALPSLIHQAARGMRDGRRCYAPLPRAVLDFYLDSGLAPDFGNQSLRRKLRARLARTA
jgi:GT2 family glycosyltransferase